MATQMTYRPLVRAGAVLLAVGLLLSMALLAFILRKG